MTLSNNNFTHNSSRSEQSGGIKNIRIDFTAIAGITDAHLRIAEALQFPDHYGKNLDALFDCLAEICKPVAVTLFGTSALTAALGSYGSMMLRVFSDAAAENPNLSVEIADSFYRIRFAKVSMFWF